MSKEIQGEQEETSQLDEERSQPRFTENGQELAVCKHCGHELIALSDPPYNRNWVHRNPHKNYPVYCQLETEAEPSEFSDNISVEAADAYLRGIGTIKKCETCGQDATLTNGFVTHLARRYQSAIDAIRAFIRDRGKHEGDHVFDLSVCSLCDEAYIKAEAALDAVLSSSSTQATASASALSTTVG